MPDTNPAPKTSMPQPVPPSAAYHAFLAVLEQVKDTFIQERVNGFTAPDGTAYPPVSREEAEQRWVRNRRDDQGRLRASPAQRYQRALLTGKCEGMGMGNRLSDAWEKFQIDPYAIARIHPELFQQVQLPVPTPPPGYTPAEDQRAPARQPRAEQPRAGVEDPEEHGAPGAMESAQQLADKLLNS